jgi:pimeloyl-[acyl-carrier protein] methyl ester esterase
LILFVHGWGYDASFWDPVRAALGDVPSATLDLGYFGAADTSVPRSVTLLVGHSLGFLWLARQSALKHLPLIGINAFPRFLEAEDYRPAVAPRVLERMRRRVVSDTRGVLEDFWGRAGATGPQSALNTAALAEGLDHLAAWDERENLASRASHTRLIAGREDAIVPAAMTEMAFRGSQIAWLRGGHALPRSHAADIARLIRP